MQLRDEKVDIFKGIAILCVVLGHCGFPYTEYLYLFHMAAFIMISGYCFNEAHSESLTSFAKYIVRKLKTLYLPYALFNICIICFMSGL